MKRLLSLALCSTIVFSFSVTDDVEAKKRTGSKAKSSVVTSSASKNTKVSAFSNCKELNAKYPGGVALSANVKNKGGKTKFKPTVSPDLYNMNKKLDRDKDGIACER
ncbi:excalibur calcium-binding domain-containing protein [Anoxybacillus sp. ST4]|uniref:excalibur calcium-binding domain-containing protein n=1 Tax=Anoxybacillus sp. ST4 TaxID=2864181 RepID=UPI001C6415A5|nr:excalibur calcium-binding domain-containing protein [Anoxybacillus sp. ST4]MBW7651547.1 excalibur calcium-binding domain-containing protein [Anoxybacillus sp. ST4]